MNQNYGDRDALHWASVLIGLVIFAGVVVGAWYGGIGLGKMIQWIASWMN